MEANSVRCKVPVVALVLPASCNASRSTELSGAASIIDGDTLEIHGTRFRMWRIDAPESSQFLRDDESSRDQCGAKAGKELDTSLLDGRSTARP
jgi:endonuclease YncB( thermonuclease family)